MKFGLRLPTYIFEDGTTATLDDLVAYAVRAEELGFDSLWVVDHYLVAAPSYRVAFLDPMIVLSAMASVTKSIRLGTSVLQLPLRQPVMLAKEISTLDFLSNGRFEFGIGAGWQAKEFEGAGASLTERGRRIDDYLEAMIALWTQDEASYHGEFINFDGIRLLPRPVQFPYPRLSFGGGNTVKPVYADDPDFKKSAPKLNRVFRRIGRYASGWQATSVSDPELMREDWEQISMYAREAGRDPSDIERMQTTYMIMTDQVEKARYLYGQIVGKDFDEFLKQSDYLFGPPAKLIEELHRREAMGIDRMIITPVRGDLQELDTWATAVPEPVGLRPG